jgi:hypothetical protein
MAQFAQQVATLRNIGQPVHSDEWIERASQHAGGWAAPAPCSVGSGSPDRLQRAVQPPRPPLPPLPPPCRLPNQQSRTASDAGLCGAVAPLLRLTRAPFTASALASVTVCARSLSTRPSESESSDALLTIATRSNGGRLKADMGSAMLRKRVRSLEHEKRTFDLSSKPRLEPRVCHSRVQRSAVTRART